MLSATAAALAAAGGSAVVQVMVSDSWESAKRRLVRLLRRSEPDDAAEVETRLEMTRARLAELSAHELEEAQRVQALVWQAHLVQVLERDPEAEAGLLNWVQQFEDTPSATTTLVQQRAVLGSGIQINEFSGPPILNEVIGTIAVPTGRRYESSPLRGRDALVDELVRIQSASAKRAHVLHGLGGVGKSSVALEVACRVQEMGGEVWWIPAHDVDRVTVGMLILARRLGLNDAEIGHRDVADLVWQCLSARAAPWLLVFDNADDVDALTIDGAPLHDGTGWLRPIDNATGMAIVTTRHGNAVDWGGWCHLHLVGMLSPADGAQVLLDQAGPQAGTRMEAEDLSKRLGGLSLALRLAGSYLMQSQQMPSVFAGSDRARTFGEYMRVVDNNPPDVGFPSQQRIYVSDREARLMLGRTWELSVELLERRGIIWAPSLLGLLSCFADAPIPYAALLDPKKLSESELFATAIQGLEVWKTLQALSDTGLVNLPDTSGSSTKNEDSDLVLYMHPLVRDISRPKEQESGYIATVTTLLAGAALNDGSGLPEDPTRWPLWQFLTPHSLYILNELQNLSHANEQTWLDAAKATYMSARHLAATGAYAQAMSAYQNALTVRENLLGLQAPDTLSARYGVARMTAAQGRYREAAEVFQQILAAREHVLGPDHPDTLNARYGVVRMAAAQGRYQEAEELYRNILLVTERIMGTNHPETLRARFGIARMSAEQGRYAEAEAIYRSMLATQEDLAASAAFYDQPDPGIRGHQEATTVYREVLAVEERLLGPDQPDGLTIHYAIAQMAAAQGRYDDAERAYKQVLKVEEETLGTEHPDTLTTWHWIGRMAHAQGQHHEAEELLRQVLARREQVLGSEHPNTLTTRHWIARTMEAQGRHSEAEELWQDVLLARRRVLGEEHPHVKRTFSALEQLRRRRNRA